jgi:hypothetical protein
MRPAWPGLTIGRRRRGLILQYALFTGRESEREKPRVGVAGRCCCCPCRACILLVFFCCCEEKREIKLHHASSIKDRTSMSSVVSSRGIAITLLESITDSQVVPRDH